MMLELYKNIKKYRSVLNLSQEELAIKAGYTDRSSIAKIEKGLVDLPQSKIIQFAKIFGISAGELMGNDGLNIILDDNEIDLIDKYRMLNKEGKKMLLKQLSMMLKDGDFIKDTPQKEQAM